VPDAGTRRCSKNPAASSARERRSATHARRGAARHRSAEAARGRSGGRDGTLVVPPAIGPGARGRVPARELRSASRYASREIMALGNKETAALGKLRRHRAGRPRWWAPRGVRNPAAGEPVVATRGASG
jgi:hypothetical protein